MVGLWGCHAVPPEELQKMVPGLSKEMAQHLAQDGKKTYLTYAKKAGPNAVGLAYALVFVAPATDSDSVFLSEEARLLPYLQKLADALTQEPTFLPTRRRYDVYLRRPPSERRTIVRLFREQRTLALDTRLSFEEKAKSYRELIDRCLPYEDALDIADLYATFAGLLPRLNRENEMAQYLSLGAKAAVRAGDVARACQILGTLGVFYSDHKDYESMRTSWDEALKLARQANSWQEARILSFYAAHYANRGKLALSRELSRRSLDRCRELGAAVVEIRFFMNNLVELANLECWPVIGSELPRANVLLEEARKVLEPQELQHWSDQAQKFRAMYLSATGSCAEAETLASSLSKRIAGGPVSPNGLSAQLDLARSLRRCGKLTEALRILEEGSRLCRKYGMWRFFGEYDLEIAEIRYALGDYSGCRNALETFERGEESKPTDQVNRELVRHDVLSVRLAMALGDRVSARKHAVTGLEGLARLHGHLDLSPDAAMALPAAADLGDLAHEMLDTTPEIGYAREMAWRMEQAGRSNSDILGRNAALLPLARDALKRLGQENSAHCVYRVESEKVVRWTAYKGRVIREDLPLRMEDLENRVSAVRASMLPSATPSDSLVREAHALAGLLLPTFVLTDHGPENLFITTDGPLRQLPFEILNVSPSGYLPLASRIDVAYAVFDRPKVEMAPGPAMVMSEPVYSADLSRRYSILTEPLHLGTQEAVAFARLFPNATLVSGADATKTRLLKSWESAGTLYFVCHTLQDPEIPYITFLPLATSGENREEDAYLDVVDVRGADLSKCRLVVLSSCVSGANYVSGRACVPSLAEAFVGAGAKAVISTGWNVEDEDAARVMAAFADEFGRSQHDPVRALNDARRKLFRDGASPKVWASYSIMLGEL